MKSALIAAAALLVPVAAVAQTDDAPAEAAIDAHYTLDTPIKDLIADPQAKAVLDKDLPGMSSDENLPRFEDKSLRALQPLSGGQITDDLLKKVAADLSAAGGGDAAAPTGEDAAGSDSAALPDDAAPADDGAMPGDSAKPVGDPQAPVGR
jgi:hypothetical protein